MYRILAVIIFSLVSCVLSDPANNTAKVSSCVITPAILASRYKINNCFKNVVTRHLNSSRGGKTITDLHENMNDYFDKMQKNCNYTIPNQAENLMELINFSLRNNTFQEFYRDIECVKQQQQNISQCVKQTVGFFNLSKSHKHSSWYRKTILTYDDRSCKFAHQVKDCAVEVLGTCHPTTGQYVASLFDFSLQPCNKLQNKAHKKDITSSPMPVLTIVFGVVALIIILGLITVILFQLRHKMACLNIKTAAA